jgi:hypothetical protein
MTKFRNQFVLNLLAAASAGLHLSLELLAPVALPDNCSGTGAVCEKPSLHGSGITASAAMQQETVLLIGRPYQQQQQQAAAATAAGTLLPSPVHARV